MGKIQNYKKLHNILSTSFALKKSANSKHLGSIMIPRARGVRRSPKETEDMSIN